MKKRVIFIVIIVIFLILSFILFLFLLKQKQKIDKFNMEDYQWEIDNFISDKNVGEVNNIDKAIENAKELWIEEYISIDVEILNSIEKENFEVSYDFENKCWHVSNIVPSNMLGGVLHVIVEENGNVLAIWRED